MHACAADVRWPGVPAAQAARDAAGMRKLAQYMLQAPFALEKMSYDPESGMVLYRSRMHKTLKRNFQQLGDAAYAPARRARVAKMRQ